MRHLTKTDLAKVLETNTSFTFLHSQVFQNLCSIYNKHTHTTNYFIKVSQYGNSYDSHLTTNVMNFLM